MLAVSGNLEIKPIVGKLAEKGIGSVEGVLEFLKEKENLKIFSERELQLLYDLQKICEKICKKYNEKFENIYSKHIFGICSENDLNKKHRLFMISH